MYKPCTVVSQVEAFHITTIGEFDVHVLGNTYVLCCEMFLAAKTIHCKILC